MCLVSSFPVGKNSYKNSLIGNPLHLVISRLAFGHGTHFKEILLAVYSPLLIMPVPIGHPEKASQNTKVLLLELWPKSYSC